MKTSGHFPYIDKGSTSVNDGTIKKADEKKTCYYCGVRELCDYQFHKEDMRNITCDKSCMTFNGYTEGGHRILVRDCGYFVSNECKDNQEYEGVAVGRICHCKDEDFCNHGPKTIGLGSELIGMSLIIVIINSLLFGWLWPSRYNDRINLMHVIEGG